MLRLVAIILSLSLGGLLMVSCSPYGGITKGKKGEPVAVIKTGMGTITAKLFPDKAPRTCENFMTLAKSGYYNGIIFHRVIKNFRLMA